MNINKVSIGVMVDRYKETFGPKFIEVFISDDNKVYKSVKKIEFGNANQKLAFAIVQQVNINIENQSARYVKVFMKNQNANLSNSEIKNSKLSIDEITIE